MDFDDHHRRALPSLLAAGRAATVAHAARGLASLALRLPDGRAYTYRPEADGMVIEPGDDRAETVLELDLESWQGLVAEFEAAAGLLYAERVRCVRGHAIDLMTWEPALRALYNGHPLYDPTRLDLRDRRGQPLDPGHVFGLDDERVEMAHFLRTAGYLFVREVCGPAEIATMRAEADALRGEARRGDKLSWWGKDARGEETLCRVTRASAKPQLATLASDARILSLVELADETLTHHRGEGEGVTVIYKHPGMREGLGDLPWHRDCGMGGHAALCPTLIASLFLTDATPETGDLRMLPGSRDASFNAHVAERTPLPVASFRARPGDLSLHYGDTVHAAPPPEAEKLDRYRVSAIVGFAPPHARHHRGEGSYNDALHRRADGQIEHLDQVAKEN